MAQNSKLGKQYRRDERQIAGTNIHVGQLQWGLQTIKSWSNAVQAAESVHNPRRKPLYDFYNNIEKDPHLDSIMDKRTRAVKTGELVWEGVTNDNMLKQLRSPWMLDLLGQIMSRVFYGYTLLYFKTNRSGIMDVEIVPRQNVNPELGLITRELYGNTGISYLDGRYPKVIMPIGKPNQLGKLSRVGPYALMKKDNLVFYAYHNQFFGMPLRIYYYEPGNMTQRREMESAAEAAQAAPYMVVPRMPSGSGVDVKDSNKSGASTAYGDFHKIMNDEMSISILGQTLTTSNDGVGSNALGRVHEAVEEAVNLEDMLTTEYILNFQVLPILRANGYPIPEGAECHFKRTERLSGVQKIQMFATAAEHTMIKDEDWHNVMGTEMPTEAELKKFRENKTMPPKADPAPPDPEEEEEDTPPAPEGEKGQKKKTRREPAEHLTAQLNALYFGGHHLNSPLRGDAEGRGVSAAYDDDLSKIWDRITRQLHSGQLQAGDVDQELYELIAAELWKGVQNGFGSELTTLDTSTPDYEMLAALRENIYVFSGFKNYQTLKAASELLIDPVTGVKRSFSEFAQEVLTINNEYNINYLYAEYQNAMAQSQMASKWLRFQEDKEALPYLQVDVVLDERTRHRKWNGITRRVDDAFWDTGGLPPFDWGCRCTVRQLSEGPVTPKSKLPDLENLIKEEFQYNPGKEKTVFPKSHPYYKVAEKDQGKAEKNFNLRIPRA